MIPIYFLVMLPCGIRCSLMSFNYFKMTSQNKNTYFYIYISHPGNKSLCMYIDHLHYKENMYSFFY